VSLPFYRDRVGMKVVADQYLDHRAIRQLWDLPEETSARAVFLKNAYQSVMLELVEFQPNSGKAIRQNANLRDFGLYDLALLVRDIAKINKDLIGSGFVFAGPPIVYPPGLFPFDVKESILKGPDETPVTHMEMMTPSDPEFEGDYGRIVGSTQIVDDTDEAIRFYRDLMGLTLRGDVKMPPGLLDGLCSLPEGTEARMAFLNRDGSDAPAVGTLEFSAKGNYLAPLTNPPNLGPFTISFETDDLAGLTARFEKQNINILAGPVEMELVPYGQIRLIDVEGPGKARIEFFERGP
jgi:catechol 2,3-dioxygenase-like lactoylglutathione lyase family enzyme